MPSGVTGYHI